MEYNQKEALRYLRARPGDQTAQVLVDTVYLKLRNEVQARHVLQKHRVQVDAAGVKLEEMQGCDMRELLGRRDFFRTRFALFVLPIAMKKHKKLLSGMLKDVQNGRKCEIDYVNGVVCKVGREFGVPTPLNDAIVEIVHGIENGLYEISPSNLDFIG